MSTVSRRRAMTIMAAGGAGAALTSLTGGDEVKAHRLDHRAIMTTEEQAATVIPAARAFAGQHSPKPLPFDPAKLKGLSEKLLKSHWENNYSGAGKALDLIKQWFGSYEQWEAEFKKTANALGGGSGWTILSYNLHAGEVHNYWAWDHMHNAPMGYPLLVLDMYEHAYQMDYGAAAAKYVDAFMQNVNWDEVNRRVEEMRLRK